MRRHDGRMMRAQVVIAALWLLPAAPAYAIPSPELIVGSVTSISQLVSLLAATIGGALVVGSRGRSRAAPTGSRHLALALGLAALSSLAVNAYQYLDGRQQARARLETTLIRPTPKARDGATLDPLLREIPYAAQATHPLGLDTADADALVADIVAGRRGDWRILDIRETAETETGTLPTAEKIRFPDLPTADIDLKAKKSLLICHNGNRSAETCAALAAKGIDCRFIRGGLEKWLTEGRPGFGNRGLEDLRAIPDYKNHRTLLDTAAVKRQVAEEHAVFVDVRYPGEFAAGHLPGAQNLPLRSTPSPEIVARLVALRRGPVIVPCYDRRSCFFGEILGLMLTRAGGDFRGRYTVPWDYFVPPPPPPHVERFLAEHNRSLLARGADVAAAGLDRLSQATGALAAILLAALLSRIAVLPFSLKAERDQAAARRLGPEVAALKQRLAGDPARLGRAMRALYRRECLTPVRNLLALLFLPVMAVISLAVQKQAAVAPEAYLWLPSLAERDPLLILPALASAVLLLYVQQAFDLTGRRRAWLWLLALPLLTASLALLGAGVDLYVLASAVLLVAQRIVVTGALTRAVRTLASRRRRARQARQVSTGIVPLSADPVHLSNCGNKALHLARLKSQGLVVPGGVVLTGRFLANLRDMPDKQRGRLLDRLWRQVGAEKLAVRSSAEAEDGKAHSFAGVFESVLDVDRAGLEAAIARVHASFGSDRVRAYGVDGGVGNVILQHMIKARYAGVLFTRDPAAAGYMMVEMVEGCGEALVSGAATPMTFRFSRLPGSAPMPGCGTPPPIDVAPLLAIGRRAESHFGAAQDIEWAFADGAFYVVQSRDIVGDSRDSGQGIVQAEWARVMACVEGEAPTAVVFTQNEMTEMLPQPTQLSLSLMNEFWTAGGSLDLACRRLGLTYAVDEDSPPLVTSVMGRLYVDQRQASRRGPGIAALDARRLRRSAETIERDFTEGFLPGFIEDIALAEVANYERMPVDRLLTEFARRRRSFVAGTHVEVDVVNILAQFYLQDASGELRRLGLDPVPFLAPREANDAQRILHRAAGSSAAEREALLVEGWGHRAVLDYELSEPRFAEAPQALSNIVAALPTAKTGHVMAAASGKLPPATQAAVDRAQRFQALKETAKHHALRELAQLRHLALAIDRRVGLDGNVFHLTLDELENARPEHATRLRRLAAERRRNATAMAAAPALPAALTPSDICTASAGLSSSAAIDDAVRGTRVAGNGAARGRARVVSDAEAEHGKLIAGFEDGDIIVARMIHPAWIVYFPRAGGLVSELGGWLSHTALLARECNLPMIVGVRDRGAIADGATVTLELDGAVRCDRDLEHALAAE